MKSILKIVFVLALFIWAEQKAIDHQYEVVREAWIADSDWQTASGSFYDPHDPKQTRLGANGIGATGNEIINGSVAVDSTWFRSVDGDSYLQIADSVSNKIEGKKSFNLETPHGINIVRIDDRMGSGDPNKRRIDFFYKDLSREVLKMGRFNVRFRLMKKIVIKQLIGFNGFSFYQTQKI